eukprot:COSAG02_NODE_42076_length_388_cov_0.740484_1_plen_52_part_10
MQPLSARRVGIQWVEHAEITAFRTHIVSIISPLNSLVICANKLSCTFSKHTS